MERIAIVLRKHKVIAAIVAGVTLLVLLLMIGIGVGMYQTANLQTNAINLAPTDVTPESYWVIGTFGPGMFNSYEPENQPDPAKPCRTPSGEELRWVVKNIIPGVQCLDFRRSLQKKNTDDTVAYALVYVHSPTNQAGELLLGSDDTITVWVNRLLVHESAKLRPGRKDEDKAPVRWTQGWNSLLIKVGNSRGDHLFFATLSGARGLRASTTKDLN